MENNLTRIFVYGSLRSGFQTPAYEYISKHFSIIGPARVKGKLYDMGNYPVAVPADGGDYYIVGELYQHNNPAEFAWAIGQLDGYEGLSADDDEVELYKREKVIVYYNNATTDAWIYWYTGNTEGHPIIQSGDVFDFIKQKSKI